MNQRNHPGRVLWVKLEDQKIEEGHLPQGDAQRYLGGRGLGIKLLYALSPPGVDALSSRNPLILATGPYTGAGVFSAFFNVTTKSPLTDIADASHCGGNWGPSLKKAGFDVVIIQGRASQPCYLLIDEGTAVLKPAADLWGKGVFECQKMLKQKEGPCEVISIGPAGENLVRFAAIMNDQRAAGRGGVGAVMGSKRLKAIVVKGKLPMPVFKPEKVSAISRKGAKLAVEGGAAFAKYGSSIAFDVFNEAHTLPTRNFQGGYYYHAEKINAQALKTRYFVKDSGCFKCPLQCANIHTVKQGPYALAEVEGPEYETLMSFGSNCDNDNLESILLANYLCNDFGMDTISCGNLMALLMDLYELKTISEEDLDGIAMRWGDHSAMVSLIPLIAKRQGIGDTLAEGSYRAARKWGDAALDRVIHAKKQEYPGYDSRRSFGTGFSLATSNRGACHLRSALYVNEIFSGEFVEDGFEAHMQTLLDKEHLMAIADSLLTCKFGMRNAQFTWPVLTELHNALTGTDLSEADLRRLGERIWNLERLYNLREGIEEDLPAPRLFSEDLSDGQKDGKAISRERFLKARDLYYQARGWDEKGVPQTSKLEYLQLVDI